MNAVGVVQVGFLWVSCVREIHNLLPVLPSPERRLTLFQLPFISARRKIANTFVLLAVDSNGLLFFFSKTLCLIRFTIWTKNLIQLPIRRTVTI